MQNQRRLTNLPPSRSRYIASRYGLTAPNDRASIATLVRPTAISTLSRRRACCGIVHSTNEAIDAVTDPDQTQHPDADLEPHRDPAVPRGQIAHAEPDGSATTNAAERSLRLRRYRQHWGVAWGSGWRVRRLSANARKRDWRET